MNYHKKAYLYFALIFIAFVVLTVFIQIEQERKYKTDELRAKLGAYSEMVDEYFAHNHDSVSVLKMLPQDLRITLIKKDGMVFFDNVLTRAAQNHAERPEITAARIHGNGYAIRKSESTDSDYLYYAQQTESGDFIRLALPHTIRFEDVLQRSNLLMYVLAFFLVITFIYLLYRTEKFGRVMGTLKDFVFSVEKGDIDYKSMQFPDTDSGIIGKKVISIYEQFEKSKQQTDAERERNKQLKQEMTNNIAHELKTPVSSIRGYLEILSENKDIAPSKRDYFIERAYAQTLRLSDLISDIALITKLEEASKLFIKEKINIRSVAEEAVLDLTPSLEANQLILEDNLPDNLCIVGNHNLIYSIFRNLIENSIHYAGEKVRIYIGLCAEIFEDNDDVPDVFDFIYYDTGKGVKEIYLEKIFDRFTRLEESRNRRTGGTGLGLSIVKHAVMFHGGTITAENRPEGGLLFHFSLKRS